MSRVLNLGLEIKRWQLICNVLMDRMVLLRNRITAGSQDAKDEVLEIRRIYDAVNFLCGDPVAAAPPAVVKKTNIPPGQRQPCETCNKYYCVCISPNGYEYVHSVAVPIIPLDPGPDFISPGAKPISGVLRDLIKRLGKLK